MKLRGYELTFRLPRTLWLKSVGFSELDPTLNTFCRGVNSKQESKGCMSIRLSLVSGLDLWLGDLNCGSCSVS